MFAQKDYNEVAVLWVTVKLWMASFVAIFVVLLPRDGVIGAIL